MRTTTIGALTLSSFLVFGSVSALMAQSARKAVRSAQPAEVTMTGMIIDTHCYICHGKKGAAHRMCGQACAKAGVPLGFLSDRGRVYYLVSSTPGQNQNPKVEQYVDQRVRVTGKIYRRGGAEGIEISSINPAKGA